LKPNINIGPNEIFRYNKITLNTSFAVSSAGNSQLAVANASLVVHPLYLARNINLYLSNPETWFRIRLRQKEFY